MRYLLLASLALAGCALSDPSRPCADLDPATPCPSVRGIAAAGAAMQPALDYSQRDRAIEAERRRRPPSYRCVPSALNGWVCDAD